MWQTAEMAELLQVQAHHWHHIMQKKHLENAEKHSPKDETVVGGGEHNVWTLSSDSRNIWNYQKKILKVCTSQQFCKQIFFLTEVLLAKIADETNLYSSQENPNKPMNCTVHGTEKFLGICSIGSLIPPSNICDLWIEVLGRVLVKELFKKMLEKIHIRLHFNSKNSSVLRALIVTSFTKWEWQWIVWIKSFVKSAVWQTCHRRTDLCNICWTSY